MRHPIARSSLGLMALLATASGAQAADMLRGTVMDQAPYQPVTHSDSVNWEGFTVGGHGGLSRTFFDPDTSLQTLANRPFRNSLLGTEFNPGTTIQIRSGQDSGISYGAFVGYNMMFDDVMIGFEVDYTRADQSFTGVDSIGRRYVTSNGDVNDLTLTSSQTMRLHDYATARVRFGWAYGRFMPYATIGGAVGRFDVENAVAINHQLQRGGIGAFGQVNYQELGCPVNVACETRKNQYGYGLSAGLGAEYALTNNAFVRAEYQFIRFGDVRGATVDVNTIRGGAGLKF